MSFRPKPRKAWRSGGTFCLEIETKGGSTSLAMTVFGRDTPSLVVLETLPRLLNGLACHRSYSAGNDPESEMVCYRRPWTCLRSWQDPWGLVSCRRVLPRSSLCDQGHWVRALAAKVARARSRIPALTGAPDAVIPDDPGAGGRRTHDLSNQPGVRGGAMEDAMASARSWQGPWGLAPCRRAYPRLTLCDQHRCVCLGPGLCRMASLRLIGYHGRRFRVLAVKGARAWSQIPAETDAPAAATPDDPGVDGERTCDLPAECGWQEVPSDVRGLPFLPAMAAVRVIVASAPDGNEHLACLDGS